MVQPFSEPGELSPLPYRHHRTDRSWTGMHEWGKLSGTLAAADAKMFERLALILLRLLCTRPEEPLDTTTWIPSQGGQLLLGERTPHPLFIQPLTFSEAPENLGEPHVRQVRESVRRFLESPVEASCYLLVHNSELSSPTFREGVQAEIEKLRESGKVARAETWGRQRFLGEAFNAMTDRVLAAIRAGSLSMAPITAALDSEAGAPLAQVPLRASLLSIDQYRMRSMDDLGPRRIIDPVQVILEQDAGNLSLLLGGFGFGKTTAVGRALAEGPRQVLYVPGATISEEVKGAKDLLFRCINSDELFGVCSEGEREIYDRIVRASVEYLFKDPGLPVTVIIDGLDESPFLNRKGGLQGLFNSLYQVSVPVVLAMRTEFWDKKREEFETIVGDVARHGSTRIQKVRAIELLPWEDLQILELVRRARNAWKDPEEARRLAELENLVQQGRFESIYGDIPRRPLFLKFVLEAVAEAGLPGERIGRGALFQGWARRKILRDILNARKAGGGRPRLIADDESSESVLETSWEAMCWAASFMIDEQEGRLELLPDCSLDRVLAATPRLEKITEALPLHLQSLLLPAERKKGRTDRIAFAHRVFQEFFLAWHLLSERGVDTGRTLPDSVLEWVRDLQKEQLVEPRAEGRSPGLPAAHATPFSQLQRGAEDWTPDLELLVMERLGNSKRIFDLSVIELEEREQLTQEVLSAEGRNMGKPEPLVFLNACSSGETGLSLIGLGGWAPRLLEVGAGAFIGTLWPIKDRRGTEFARAFYEAFTGGTPLGEAVRPARLAIRSEDDPTWLAYTAFAHPLAVCAPPGSPRPASVLKPVPTNAPPRPLLFVGRRRDLEILKQRLGAEGGPQVTHPLQVLTAVRGLPGVGKSTLATALSHDPDIHSAFPGGILWASLGEDPDLLSEVAAWGRILGSEDLEMAANLQEAVLCLRNLLRDRQTLLVLDDVWDPAQVQPVQSACGEGCALLLTTRQTGVAQSFHARPDSIYTLEVLDEPDALELLAALAPEVVETYPEECRKLVRNLEYLPLSLQVAGRMLHAESRMGWDLHDLIGELGGGGGLLRETAPPDRMDLDRRRIPTIDELLRRSTDRLDSETRERFRRLGGFAAKPATFGLEALRRVWGVEDPRPTLRTLVDRGLLEPVGDSRFQMHSLLVQHAASLEA